MSQHAYREPVLASDRDLDDQQVTDVAIGLLDGPGGRFRALQRLRTTMREAATMAGRTAKVLAGASQETLLDPHCRPSAIRIAGGDDGAVVLLDYDVVDSAQRSGAPSIGERASGPVRMSEPRAAMQQNAVPVEDRRPRISRPLRLVMIAREPQKPR